MKPPKTSPANQAGRVPASHLKGEIVKEYLLKFPDAHNNTLARIIYNENKAAFKDVENVRSVIRYYRGSLGEKLKQQLQDRRFMMKPKKSFPKLPEGITTIDDWRTIKITGKHKILLLNDIHIPFHCKKALEMAIKHGKKFKPDIIILNGDILDYFSISRWLKDPRMRDFPKELKIARQFLEHLRGKFPTARIVFKEGNHEERWLSYMEVKAPELLGIRHFDYDYVLGFEDLGIELINFKKPLKVNELFILHGHEYKFAISNPVNPARGLYLRSKVNAICGHFHQSSTHSEPDLDEKLTTTWSVGCLSELHPRYMPLNKWNHGFAEIETYDEKLFQVHNYKIIDGEVYAT